jgi:uncharacterized protein
MSEQSEQKSQCDMTPGVMGWNEIVTPNRAESVAFYGGLFGWTSEEMALPGGEIYTMFNQGDRPVAGCYQMSASCDCPPMWLSYVNVADLDGSIEKAKALGGTIAKERVDLPMGSFAIVTDPFGAVFAFWQGVE